MAIKNFNDGSSLDEETNVVTDAQGVEHAPTNTITAESIATVEDVNFNEPAEVAPPLPPPDPEEPKLTETETEESDMNKRLRDINLSLTDESADETALEEEAGLEGLQATEKSLSDQIKALSADRKNISDVKQLEATGRGITAGGLAPLTMAELRKNSIQANILSAQLDAARGDVASAQTKIDKALAAKYDPIRAKQEALEKNLDLIINSPEYTLEQKARAEAKKKELDAENKEIEQQEADDKAIFDFSVQASKAGADAQTLRAIQNAKTPEEALRIAGEFSRTQQVAEFDKEMALKGFTKLQPSQLAGLTEEDILRVPNPITGVDDIYKKPEGAEDDFQFIKATGDQSGGIFNKTTGEFTPVETAVGSDKIITSPSGINYDMSTYATDPAQAQSVQNAINDIGKLGSEQDIDNYINANAPNSNITSAEITEASEKFGLGWEELLGLMKHESLLGTSNVALNNNNFGGITWSQSYQDSHPNVSKGTARPSAEGGNYVRFNTVQDGVDAMAEQLARRITSETIQKELTPAEITESNTLARQLYGTLKTEKQFDELVEPIRNRMRAGENIDDISDSLRFAGQSTEFTGAIRDAVQSVTSDYTDKKTQVISDKLDDLLSKEDPKKVQDFLKKASVDSLGTAEGQQVRGKERTVQFLDEIRDDLVKYEAAGGKTNIFSGTVEKVAKKAGAVKDEELRKIATKIAIAIQSYRRAMSGVAFSVPESKEYEAMFPNIDKTASFNRANIEALTEVFNGDLDFTYSFIMGDDAYNEIFKSNTGITEEEDLQLSDEDAYAKYLKITNPK